MEAFEVEADLIRWTGSFMSDRQVKLVLDGEVGEANPVDTGIPQGSPAAPVLFITYLSGIFDEVERAVPGIRGLSIVEDIAWWADGKDDEAAATKMSETAAASIDWTASNGVAFGHGKTEPAIFYRKGTPPNTAAKVGSSTVQFNKEVTRWLRVWLDSQLTLKDNQHGASVDGVGTQTSGSPAGEQTAAVWVTVAQPAAGRPGEIEVVGATATIGKRLENALGYSGRMENTVLLAEPETLDAEPL